MNRYSFYLTAMFFLLSMHSCIMTSEYDMRKDIDGTICFTPNGFTIGGDNSADVSLDNIIELKDSGQLTTDDAGNYLFYKSGKDMAPTTVVAGQASLCNAYEMTGTMGFESAQLEEIKRYPGYANMTLTKDIQITAKPDDDIENVVELRYVTAPMAVVVQTRFVGSISDFCNSITVTYQLPSFYDVADESELTQTIKMSAFDKVNEHVIHLKGVDFTKSGAGEKIGIRYPEGVIYMEGSIRVQAKAIVNSAKYQRALQTSPVMYSNIVVSTMATTSVTGRFATKKSIDLEPIVLDNLPKFIKDSEVVVDIDNPVVRLHLDNEVPTNVLLNAKMKGYKNGRSISQVNAGDEYGTDAIAFGGATAGESVHASDVWISRKAVTLPEGVESNVVVSDMNNLIRTIPDRVDVEATARTDSSQVVTLVLDHEYQATPSYELVAPLKIGPEMKIVYSKTIKDLHDQLKNAELSGMVFTGDVVNNVPLDLHVVMYPLGQNDKVVEGMKVNTEDVIPANSSKSVRFTIENSDGKVVQDVYALLIKLYAESSDKLAGQYLNKSQNLQIKHAKITLNGAKYNVNGK